MASVSSSKHIKVTAKERSSANGGLLSNSKALYQAVYEGLPEGIIWTDMDGNIVHANPAVESLSGYSLAELQTMPARALLHPDDLQGALNNKARRIKGEAPVPNEHRWIRKDGSLIHVESWGALLRDESGNPLAQLAGIRDLTWRKDAEKALKTSTDRYRAVFNQLQEGIVWAAPNGEIIDANPSMLQLLGYTLEELIGKRLSDVIVPAHFQTAMEMNPATQLNEAISPDTDQAIRKDGTTTPVEARATMIRDNAGDPEAIMVAVKDLTTELDGQKALRESEERYRQLFNNTPVGFVASEEGIVTSANPEAARMIGIPAHELVGQPVLRLFPDTRDGKAKMEEAILNTTGETSWWDHDLQMLRADGSVFWARANGQRVSSIGQPRRALGTFVDITGERALSEALRVSQDRSQVVFDNLQQGVVWSTADGRVTDANPSLLKLLGYTLEEIQTKQITDLVDPQSRALALEYKAKMLRGEPHEPGERVWLRKDGSQVAVEAWGHVMVDSDGEQIAQMVVVLDLTARKEAEQALKESEERYRMLFENAPIGYIAAENNVITSANPIASEMLGYSMEELQGMSYLKLYANSPDGDAKVLEKTSGPVGKMSWDESRQMIRKDGTTLWIRARGQMNRTDAGDRKGFGTFVDITSERLAEEALKESEERYRAVYSHLREAVLWANPDGEIIDANYAGLQMLGYTLDEIRTKAMQDIVSPAFLERDRALKWQVMDGGTTKLRESSWMRKDGSMVNVEVWNTVVRSSDGQPVALMGVATDVTERNQARNDLLESEERYRLLFENAPVGNITTVSRTITAANPEAAKMFGMNLEEMIGKDILSLYAPTPDGYDKAAQSHESFNPDGGEWSDEFRMQRTDGQMFWVMQSRRTVVTAYGVTENHGTIVDITREKETEAALRRSEEHYHAIYEELQDGIVQVGRSGEIRGVNQAFADLTGYTVDELHTMQFADLTEPGNRSTIPETIQQLFSGEHFPAVEKLLVRKDETHVPVEVAATLLKDGIGNPEAIMIMVRDLRKQRETHQVNRELAVMEERTRFAREIHDTVAQTLTGLVSQIDAVTSIVADDQELVLDKLLVARGLASSCLDQTRTALLDLKPSELRPGGLTDAIRTEVEGLKLRGLDVELKVHGIEPVSTNEDNAVALYRIIQESLSNAFKHSQANHVSVDLIFGPDDAVVEIADNGVGFDTNNLRQQTTTSSTGFGMGVMHERASVAGGELTVVSARGAGTRVIGRIPYTLSTASIAQPQADPVEVVTEELSAQSPCRVLLVDDHELVRRGTRALVEMATDMLVVGEAATGDGALAIAHELQPDIILMDIHMPSKNGIEVTKELTVSLPDSKVILLTVYDDDDHVREGIRAGAKGYLIKGATKEEIINGIRTVYAGGSLVPASVVGKLAEPIKSDLPDLSGREREVLHLLADGASTKEIGEQLVLSLNTVNFHLRNLYQKLGVRSRTQAIKVGQQVGLLELAKHPINVA